MTEIETEMKTDGAERDRDRNRDTHRERHKERDRQRQKQRQGRGLALRKCPKIRRNTPFRDSIVHSDRYKTISMHMDLLRSRGE